MALTQITVVKRIARQDDSLIVAISEEAKQMNLEEGDKVNVSLSYADLPQDKEFIGLPVLRLLMDGHILRSADGSVYAMFDPQGISRNEPCKSSFDICLAYADSTDVATPKLTWTGRCNDALVLATSFAWSVESYEVAAMINRNTRAYLAIITDARQLIFDKDEEITEEGVDRMIRKLHAAGWEYDDANDKGVYDVSKLDLNGYGEVDAGIHVTKRLPKE